jgi:predicted transcriptional regulator
VRLARASVTKTCTLLGVSRAAVSKVMTAYVNRGKMSTAMRNSGRKPNLNERNRCTLKRIVIKNHRTTAAKVTEEHDIYLEGPFSTETV